MEASFESVLLQIKDETWYVYERQNNLPDRLAGSAPLNDSRRSSVAIQRYFYDTAAPLERNHTEQAQPHTALIPQQRLAAKVDFK